MTTKKALTPRNLYGQKVANIIHSGDPVGIRALCNILNIDAVEYLNDDFFGDLIGDEWRENASGASAAVANSLYTITSTGTADNYNFLVGNIGWLPSKGAFMQTRVKIRTATALAKVELGFTSAVATTGAVSSLGDGDWIPTFTDTSCVSFVWDTNSDQTKWCAVAAAPKKKVISTVAPEVDVFHTFGVGVDGTTATFYIDGKRQAVIDSPTTATTTSLAPYVGIVDRGEIRVVDVDYILVLQSRNS